MKKFIKLIILTISILIVSVPVFANSYDVQLLNANSSAYTSNINELSNNSIKVQLNGDYLNFTDTTGNTVDPQIIDGRTMVPMRKIFEVFGATIEWDGETRSIKATTEGLEIGLQIDNNVATIKNKDGEVKEIALDVAPTIVDNRTLVPVRFIAESLDKKVGWDTENRTVVIIDSSIVEATTKAKTTNFYKYLTTDFIKLSSAEMDIKLSGSLNYTDDTKKVSDSKIDFNGNIDFKYNDTLMAADIVLKLSGNGDAYEYLKTQNMENIKLSYIFDVYNSEMYISSPLLVGYEDKWIKYDVSGDDAKTMQMLFANIQSQNVTGMDSFEDSLVSSESLTIESYKELQSTLLVMSMIFSDENFKISGSNYTLTFDLVNLLDEIYAGSYSRQEEIPLKLNMDIDMKVENKVVEKSKANVVLEMNKETNHINVEADIDIILENYNEAVSINIPNVQNVIEGTLE